MIIHLIPPLSHPAISCVLNFPCTLSLPHLPVPVAWSAQIQLLASFQLEDATNIHLFDKAVGLVARIHELELDVVQQEIFVTFIDGRSIKTSMSMDCARMLQSVADDVRASSESEGHRDRASSATSSVDDLHFLNRGYPPSPVKVAKHKRQRSLIFSLISSLVPKSTPSVLSLSQTGQPRSSLSAPGSNTRSASPSPSKRNLSSSPGHDVPFFRARARATLLDAWRLYILSALSMHMPVGGYVEWVLSGLAAKTRTEVRAIEHEHSYRHEQAQRANNHARCKSEGRNAFDLGERRWIGRHWRLPLSFSDHASPEDTEDRVVYPRRAQANEWGVRIRPQSPDGLDAYTFGVNCENESLMGERFSFGDDDLLEDPQFTFDVDELRPQILDIDEPPNFFFKSHVRPGGSCSHNNGVVSGLANTLFNLDVPTRSLDTSEDDESDKSQPSPRTPDESEGLPLTIPSSVQAGLQSQQQPISVARMASSRPRPRTPPPSQIETATPREPLIVHSEDRNSAAPSPIPSRCFSRTSSISTTALSPRDQLAANERSIEGLIAERLAYLERIQNALKIVRTRAQEEGWRLIRASMLGGPAGWSETESDRLLEAKAKRRAWSSGLKIAAPYVPPSSDLSFESVPAQCGLVRKGLSGKPHPPLPADPQHNDYSGSSPAQPSGSFPQLPPCRGPLVPTGLSLGKPLSSSPLAVHVWTAHDLQLKNGKPTLKRVPASLVLEKWADRGSYVSFPESPTRSIPESPTRLFPLCEESEESEDGTNSADCVAMEQCMLGHGYLTDSVTRVNTAQVGRLGAGAGVPDDGVNDDINTEDVPFYFHPTGTCSPPSIDSPSAFPTFPVSPVPCPAILTPSDEAMASGQPGRIGEGTELTDRGYEEGGRNEIKFDASSILLRPLSRLSCLPPTPTSQEVHQQQPRRPSLTVKHPYVSQSHSVPQPDMHHWTRPRSMSLPAKFSLSSLPPLGHSEIDRHASSPICPSSTSSRMSGWNERSSCGFQDLSRAYVTPPPSSIGPIILSAVPAPHEQYQYPRYAHVAKEMHPSSLSLTMMDVEPVKTGHTQSSMNSSRSGGVGRKGQEASGAQCEVGVFKLDEGASSRIGGVEPEEAEGDGVRW